MRRLRDLRAPLAFPVQLPFHIRFVRPPEVHVGTERVGQRRACVDAETHAKCREPVCDAYDDLGHEAPLYAPVREAHHVARMPVRAYGLEGLSGRIAEVLPEEQPDDDGEALQAQGLGVVAGEGRGTEDSRDLGDF